MAPEAIQIQTSGGGNLSQILLIPEVDEQDSGQYFCRVNTTDRQSIVSDAVSVAVLGEPLVTLVLYRSSGIFVLKNFRIFNFRIDYFRNPIQLRK